MWLFFTLTLITFLDAYKIRLISWILKILPHDSKINSLDIKIKVMEKELSSISMMHDFAKHFKLQRKINKARDEKKKLVEQRAFKMMRIRYTLILAAYGVIIASLITIIWFYKSESVIKVPEQWLWPISSFFDWSNNTPGIITVPCWIAISSSAFKTFAKHF